MDSLFQNLFVLDLANNHQGDVGHGERVIREHSAVARSAGVKAAIKFQFRDLDSFIHLSHREQSEHPQVGRFLSTRLDWEEFDILRNVVEEEGLLTMCTPFDEPSVERIVEMGFSVLKVASASASDWPLLEKVATVDLPIVVSTGGLALEEIDKVVSLFEHRGKQFALMHCVSVYPTPLHMMQMSQITVLKERYPQLSIGWSTHEKPSETVPIHQAVALGASIFERHIGLPTKEHSLNAYSSSPREIEEWLARWKQASLALGGPERRRYPEETEALSQLARGAFSIRKKTPGALQLSHVYFAFPLAEGQISAKDFSTVSQTTEALDKDEPVLEQSVTWKARSGVEVLKSAIHEVKGLLATARVKLPHEFDLEFSHHEGRENFRATGATFVNMVNRTYCKKVVVVLPGQNHPNHFHRKKEESFQVLFGELVVEIDGIVRTLGEGDLVTVLPGSWHSFHSTGGCVFEEISTTAFDGDSVYALTSINETHPKDRKTKVQHWGRFQLLDT